MVLLGASFLFAAFTGIHHRVFSPSQYGQARFVVEGFPREIDPDDLQIVIPAEGTNIRMLPSVSRFSSDPPSIIATSLPVILKKGEYRAEATIGDRQIIARFTVQPWRESGAESKILIPLVDAGPRKLKISAQIYDRQSGKDLTSTASLEVLQGARYIPVASAGDLLSGRELTFRIRAEGYQPETIVVPVATETGSVSITIEMNTHGGIQ
jgi:hypothetical protein